MIAGVALLILLVIGSVLVLRPFIASLVWAAVLAYATWPVYEWVLAKLRGRSGPAASAMTVLLLLSIVAPFAIMGISLADSVTALMQTFREAMENPLPALPGWVESLPLVGAYLKTKWLALMQQDEGALLIQLRQFLLQLPLKEWGIKAGGALGRGVVLIAFSVLICFFFYRDGSAITARVRALMERLAASGQAFDSSHRRHGVPGGERHSGNGARTIRPRTDRFLDRRRPRRCAIGVADLLSVHCPGGATAGLGARGAVAVLPGTDRLGHLPGDLRAGGHQCRGQHRQTLSDQSWRDLALAAGIHGRTRWCAVIRFHRCLHRTGDSGRGLFAAVGVDQADAAR